MAIDVNFYDKVVYITSPTTSATVLQLLTALRDAEDSVDGITHGESVKTLGDAFADAEGKVDVGSGYKNPITITLASTWYVEFWDGVGLGTVAGGNITGGLAGRPVRATVGSADTILVLGAERGIEVSSGTSAETVANAVWDKALDEHTTAGSAGEGLTLAADVIRDLNKVYWDQLSSNVGTSYPIGSPGKPAKELSDVLVIAERYGINEIVVCTDNSSIAIDPTLKLWQLKFVGLTYYAEMTLSDMNSVAVAEFENLLLKGIKGNINDKIRNCMISNVSADMLEAKDCRIGGTLTCTLGIAYDMYVVSLVNTSTLTFASSSILDVGVSGLRMLRSYGRWKVVNKTGGVIPVALDLVQGEVEIDSTCVAGEIIISGNVEVTDNSGPGCTVTIVKQEDRAAVVDGVWDEVLADHLAAGTTGKKLSDGGTGDPAEVAAAVWDAAKADYDDPDTMGELQNTGGSGDPEAIADAVWEEASDEHTEDGTMGELQNQIDGIAIAKPKVVPGE